MQIDEAALITFSDPADTDNRLTIVTDSESVYELFSANFSQLWQEAKKIAI